MIVPAINPAELINYILYCKLHNELSVPEHSWQTGHYVLTTTRTMALLSLETEEGVETVLVIQAERKWPDKYREAR